MENILNRLFSTMTWSAYAISMDYSICHWEYSCFNGRHIQSHGNFDDQYWELFLLWDRGQLIIILSRARMIKNTICFCPKNETIHGLKFLLTKKICDVIILKNQWRSQLWTQITILNLLLLWINTDFHFKILIYHYHKIKLVLFILIATKW